MVRRVMPGIDRFLGQAKGVIHIGANHGKERHSYARLGLPVLWIEPIPAVAATLRDNIQAFPNQRAAEYLVSDSDGQIITLNIASNRGASSSILAFKEHQALWPEVNYVDSIDLESITLPTLLEREGLAVEDYDALVLDTQGAELLILQGAQSMLGAFRFIKTEAADFEAYAGCPQVEDITAFLAQQGFEQIYSQRFAGNADIGHYYDIVYRNLNGRH